MPRQSATRPSNAAPNDTSSQTETAGPIRQNALLTVKEAGMQLDGKSAMVTGAASGIGAEIARVFASAGAKVCVADIDAEGAKRTCSGLENAIAVRMDVTNEAEVERAVGETAQKLGGIDILVSN